MARRVEAITVENDRKVFIEVCETPGDVERVGIGDKAAKTFEAAWDTVQPVIRALAKRLPESGPTETQIKFGVKISADLNAVIASTNGEANFEITLSWKPRD